ncbi:alpha-N-acetylglucosaminidase [Scaptodrosophila lebanonensis]|uniref:Alpha-N-acetylglucosaminidase n=1 Tax=Drosophila lebanonensis TaxID=7225 RepID=A0A6J2U6A7_DROLE|nr:alpha-N-acetylglucosaminidase [Scaptodrosophila lebanonensis]
MDLILKLCAVIALIILFEPKAFAAPGQELAESLAPNISPDVQEQAVRELIQRVVGPNAAKLFVVEVNKLLEFRSYQISQLDDGKVLIAGWDGVSVAKGFHYYLKYVLNKDLDWFKTHIELPPNVQLPNVTYSSQSASSIIYYQNVCTWSYSFVWWNFGQWRRHIDWMALMGISLTIAPIQEAIWQDVYKQLGLEDEEIDAHLAGPAFQAWQRMGNIRGWAGPLPPNYRRLQVLLQQQILQAQRSLGMSVALPAFAGHVPVAMRRVYPNASYTEVERWNKFPDPYCCGLFVEPQDPLFKQVATHFLHRVIQRYGSNHIYFCDPFNELQPRVADADYMRATAAQVYGSMSAVDPDAVWLLQGWMFVKNIFWTDALIEAFLTAVPRGHLLVLDLQSEQFPQYQRTFSYYGQPFVWCMLHNFGGTLGMFGSVELVNKGITSARQMPNSSMVGVGITPEGIGQNYVLYSLAMECGWSLSRLSLDQWFDHYALVRYGVNNSNLAQVWQLLRGSVYAFKGLKKMRGKYTITRRPALNLQPWSWYNGSSVVQAWQLLLEAHDTIPMEDDKYEIYLHDLIDVTRQFLQQSADKLYVNLKSAYRKGQLDRFEYIAGQMLELLDDLERVLASGRHFLLGTWLEAAKRMATSAKEQPLYEFNARNQLTAWGPTGQILDYANKQWSGLVRDYYKPRWAMFLDAATLALKSHQEFNSSAFKERVANEVELPFSNKTDVYSVKPEGNPWLISLEIYEKWIRHAQNSQFLHYNRLFVKILD